MESGRLQFGRYIVDLDRGSLLADDGAEIALRPKTFAVLVHLLHNEGRLVSKDELFAAVWPKLVVTDDTLVQSIGELRRALGDSGATLIKTVPRRGYRFEAKVTHATATPAHAQEPAAPAPASRSAPAARRIGIAAVLAGALVVAGVVVWNDGTIGGVPRPGGNESPVAQRAMHAKATIAVLPFVNRSGDANREYFADGLTQDVISALGRFSELTVMSWNAVQPYKGSPASPGEIAGKLGAHYQVEGGVQPSGDRVRVTAQLVDANGRVLWSGRFDEPLTDLFALHDRITTQVAGALALRVTQIEHQRSLGKSAASLEAYDYVLRARPALQRPTRANNAEARVLLRRALEADPDCAPAYAALAETYHIAVAMGWAESPSEMLGRAGEMAGKALALDAGQARAHVTLGRIHLFNQRYEQARAELDRAIASNPSDARALAGRGNLLLWLGQTDAAIETLELAKAIDPELNAVDRFALSLAYYLKRRYDAAIEQAELNLRETAGAGFNRIVLAAAYAQSDRADDAARLADLIRRTEPGFDLSAFGTKFVSRSDLEHLREGFRKAGLIAGTAESSAGPIESTDAAARRSTRASAANETR